MYRGEEAFFADLEEALQVHVGSETPSLLAFARRIFELAPLEELGADSPQDIAAFVRSLWEHFSLLPDDSPRLRCFNPHQEEDGWEHRLTQVFLLKRDIPFLVDSVRMMFNRMGVGIHVIKSTVLRVRRDAEGRLVEVLDKGSTEGQAEALVFLRIDRCSDDVQLEVIGAELLNLLARLKVVTDDYQPMLAKLDAIVETTTARGVRDHHAEELLAFLHWVKDNHFTFLGYCYYSVSTEDDPQIVHAPEQGLGLFRADPLERSPARLSELAPGFSEFHNSPSLLTLARSSLRSTIHRDAYCEYLIIKDCDAEGRLVGEHRFLGLYTSSVHSQSPFAIPLVKDKLQRVLQRSGLAPDTHDGKALRKIMESHPREELFHASEQQLHDILIGIWQIQERRKVRLFLRPDPYEKFVNCLLYVPRDSYRTEVREQAEAVLCEMLDGSESHFTTYFTDSLLVRIHFVVRIRSSRYRVVDARQLEQEIAILTRDWRDELEEAILDYWGEEKGLLLCSRFRDAFPVGYREHFAPRVAVHDLELILRLGKGDPIAMRFYQPPGSGANFMRFKVFHSGVELLLSNIVPMLENLGFLVIGEHPYRIVPRDGEPVQLHEFSLQFVQDIPVDVPGVRDNFQDAFAAVWCGRVDNDSFNRLVVGARLDWQSVAILRVYARYMKQLGVTISQDFIAATLAANVEITRNIVALFRTRFDPRLASQEGEVSERSRRLESKILEALDQIENLNEDQVLRSYLQLICATVRTSFFQRSGRGCGERNCHDDEHRPYVALKLMPRGLPMVPDPQPEYEVFVCSPRMEGVHLRAGKVARGGIRWSSRLEDYRTEVLGLVKAQQVKNAVIVPTGAKGGFVVKKSPAGMSRDEWQAEGIACYRMFMRALLDITDNVVDGKLVPPPDMVRMDGDDAYMVVAADKGTASFSDIANAISEEYGHWLGDAFASGGSHGYDHKKMGITARGAWVAVQRHFRELGLDPDRDGFTVVGIGDMSGDVFGNGMLRSRHTRLVAAFNHQSIFLDPDPDAEVSFAERQRLFVLPRSSWEDYNPELISPGGGVYSRNLKSIAISPQVKERFGIAEDHLTPAQLINRLLQAEVDLIWNGGIGTYVKSSTQSHAVVGDKANDELRVDGRQLRCRVFGEGGNLGMTQAGRVEYALNGGCCNTDFIDNMGGVACSDLEVNIKILLNQLVRAEDLTVKQRNELLVAMTEAVAALVLGQSDRQTLGISLARYRCEQNLSEFWSCISDWEAAGVLNRKLDGLPDDAALAERQKNGQALTRPELAVLVSHGKSLMKKELLASDALADDYLFPELLKAFPPLMGERFRDAIDSHPLRNEILANQLANEVIDRMGLSFTHRMMQSTGADAAQVARAYVIVRDVLKINEVWAEIDSPGIPARIQLELLARLMRLGRRATRWVIRNRRTCTDTRAEVERLQPLLEAMLESSIIGYEDGGDADSSATGYLELGLSPYAAMLVDSANDLFYAFGMADVALRSGLSIDHVIDAYAQLEVALGLNWFSEQIIDLPSTSRWEDFARESFMDQLETLFRKSVLAMVEDLVDPESIPGRISEWQVRQPVLFERWQSMLRELRQSAHRDYAMFSVALRELQDLVDTLDTSATLGEVCATAG